MLLVLLVSTACRGAYPAARRPGCRRRDGVRGAHRQPGLGDHGAHRRRPARPDRLAIAVQCSAMCMPPRSIRRPGRDLVHVHACEPLRSARCRSRDLLASSAGLLDAARRGQPDAAPSAADLRASRYDHPPTAVHAWSVSTRERCALSAATGSGSGQLAAPGRAPQHPQRPRHGPVQPTRRRTPQPVRQKLLGCHAQSPFGLVW